MTDSTLRPAAAESHLHGGADARNDETLAGIARGGAFAGMGSAFGAAFGLILTLVVTHGLDRTTAGQYFSATAVFLVLQTLLAFGVGAGLVRFVPRFVSLDRAADLPALLRIAVGPVIIAGAVTSVLLWVLAGDLASVVGHEDAAHLVPTFRVIAAFFLPATLEVAAIECTRAFGGLRRYVLVQQMGIPLLRPLLVGIGAAAGLPLSALVALWLIPLVVALAIGVCTVRGRLRAVLATAGNSAPKDRSTAIAREYWSFTAARGTAMVMEILLTWLDVILVASFVAPAEAAIYAGASRFVLAGTLVLQALRLTIATDISSALALDLRHRVSEIYRTATQWVVLFSWPAYLIMALFAATVLHVLGSGYSSGATAMTVLCGAMMVNLLAGNVGTVLLMGGKSMWVLADKTACVVVNVGLNVVLIPHFHIAGAAVAWAATIVLDSALSFWQVRRGMSIAGSLSGVALAAGAAVVCFGGAGVVTRLVLGDTAPGLAAAIVAGGAIYVPLLVCLRRTFALDLLFAAVRRRPGSRDPQPTSA